MVTGKELQALRKSLQCTARELADTLQLDVATVRAWEQEEEFPTRKWVLALERLREQGPVAIPRRRRKPQPRKGLAALAEPTLWEIVAKLAAHPNLREQVARLVADYDLPDDE